jgi:hypothetical protein
VVLPVVVVVVVAVLLLLFLRPMPLFVSRVFVHRVIYMWM